MPVNFNEPLSMLQRLTEDLEYSSILDLAATMTDSREQLAAVAAFTGEKDVSLKKCPNLCHSSLPSLAST